MGNQYEDASAFILRNRSSLATSIAERIYGLEPGTWAVDMTAWRQHSYDDIEYHLSFLAEALTSADPSLFLEYTTWCKVFFAGLKFPEDMIPTTFAKIRDILREILPPEIAAPALEFVAISLENFAKAPSTLPSFISENGMFADAARLYMDALLAGRRSEASKIVMDAMASGADIKDMYLHVFQPSQLEIGRLWQTNHISVAQEHYCTAATQMIMSQLFPYLFSTSRKGRNLVMTCVGGELHEIGARMVSDFFELDGWDTYFLGANVPTSSIIRTIKERKADLLAISATFATHVHLVGDLIAAVRTELGPQFRIIVGGYPFNVMPALWQKIGADGYAADAERAVEIGNRLVALAS